ncbi:MAG: beta-galactosidase [Candidatus Methanofastidiosia archaeon]
MKILMARIEPFDIETIKEDIDRVVERFSEYLDTYTPKNRGTSMYAMLGPVNQIIQKSATTLDPEELTGYGIRVHENKSYLSYDAKDRLQDAVSQFVSLLGEQDEGSKTIPRIMKPRIIERIRYKLYFKRKAQFLDYLRERESEFRKYLQSRFESLEDLNSQTGEEFNSWEEVKYPTKTRLKKYSDEMKKISTEFIDLKAKGELIEDSEEEF